MLIDGKAIAKSTYDTIATRVAQLSFQPVFCDVLVGEDPASVQYVHMKAKKAEQLGFKFLRAQFARTMSENEIVARVRDLSRTPHLSGLIVQLPVPVGFNKQAIVNAISTELDVDCLTERNLELFYAHSLPFVPPTPAAVLALLDSLSLPMSESLRCVIVGHGELVGKPVAYLLKARGMQVDVITKETIHPERVACQADVLITAVGQPRLVTAEWVKEGAVVIDAGTAESEGSVVGDVEAESVQGKASYLSPTPGGVGPVTVARLFWNVLQVAEAKERERHTA